MYFFFVPYLKQMAFFVLAVIYAISILSFIPGYNSYNSEWELVYRYSITGLMTVNYVAIFRLIYEVRQKRHYFMSHGILLLLGHLGYFLIFNTLNYQGKVVCQSALCIVALAFLFQDVTETPKTL